jgi:signal transduction histidine kinase
MQREYCEVMKRGLFRANNTINSMMASVSDSRLPEQLLTVVDVYDVLETVLSLSSFRASIHNGVGRACRVMGRRDRLEMVFWNLLKNAEEALIGRHDGRIEISCDIGQATAVISVHDNGPGIAESIRADLFTLGKTYGKRNGNGLGLYGCRMTLQALGGSIRFESHPHEGTTFHVELRTPPSPSDPETEHAEDDTTVMESLS